MASISRRHEARALLVPRQDQLDRFRARQAVEEVEIFLARHAENIFDAFFLQAFDEQVGCFFHATVAPSAAHHTGAAPRHAGDRSEEHTSELQSLMRNSYAVFCLKKKNKTST